jgi:hypothetical protein
VAGSDITCVWAGQDDLQQLVERMLAMPGYASTGRFLSLN